MKVTEDMVAKARVDSNWHMAANLNAFIQDGYCKKCGLVPVGCEREGCGPGNGEFIDPESQREEQILKPFCFQELHMHFEEIEESIENPFPHNKAYRVRGGFSDVADIYFAEDCYTILLDNYPCQRKKFTSWIPVKTFQDFIDDMKRAGVELTFVPEAKKGGRDE